MSYNSKLMRTRLVTFRKIDNNYSMQDMAELIGISKATYSRIENGKLPDLLTFFKIIIWLGDDPINYIKN